jgi:hypothetical protein
MANSNRPVAVLVMAILNLVFGGLALCCCGCGALGLLAMPSFADKFPKEPPNIAFDLLLEAPGFRTLNIGSLLVGCVLAFVLIVASLGLLGMKPWARILCIVWAGVQIVVQAAEFLVSVFYVNPMIKEWQADWYARHNIAPPSTSSLAESAMTALPNFVVLGHAVALIIVIFLPSVTAAFSGSTSAHPPEAEDYYDVRPDDDDPR